MYAFNAAMPVEQPFLSGIYPENDDNGAYTALLILKVSIIETVPLTSLHLADWKVTCLQQISTNVQIYSRLLN